MPRQPLPPDVLTRLVALYEETGNVSEVARRTGIPRPTVQCALRRLTNTTRQQIHARACERGLREGRRGLRAELRRMLRYTEASTGDGSTPGIEPRDYAALARAQVDLNRVLISHDERVTERRTEALQRELLRVKIDALRGLGANLTNLTDEELATVGAILEHARTRLRGPTPDDPSRAGTPVPRDPANDDAG